MVKRSNLSLVSILCLLIIVLGGASAQAAVTWPTDSQWNQALNADWEYLTDPIGDANKNFIDFKPDPTPTGGAAFAWYFDGTNLFFG